MISTVALLHSNKMRYLISWNLVQSGSLTNHFVKYFGRKFNKQLGYCKIRYAQTVSKMRKLKF